MNSSERMLFEAYTDFINDDITFCANMCLHVECMRHECHIKHPLRPHSVAYFYATEECPYDETGALKQNVD